MAGPHPKALARLNRARAGGATVAAGARPQQPCPARTGPQRARRGRTGQGPGSGAGAEAAEQQEDLVRLKRAFDLRLAFERLVNAAF